MKAIGHRTRATILDLVLERAATTTELAEALGQPKGTVGHHLKVLEAAGLVRVVATRQVRALTAKYYGRTGRTIVIKGDYLGAEHRFPMLSEAMEEATEAMGAGVVGDDDALPTFTLRHVRLSEAAAAAFAERLHALAIEFSELPRERRHRVRADRRDIPDHSSRAGGPTRGAPDDRRRRDTARIGPEHTAGPGVRQALDRFSVISNLGDGIGFVAYPWLASAITRNPLLIALIAVAQRLPWLVFTLPAGVITDRVDRRKAIVLMDVVRTGLTLVVAFVVLGAERPALARPGGGRRGRQHRRRPIRGAPPGNPAARVRRGAAGQRRPDDPPRRRRPRSRWKRPTAACGPARWWPTPSPARRWGACSSA